MSEPDVLGRVCQRGVDGSAGCGHDEGWLGRETHTCQKPLVDKYPGIQRCLHKCDFSPLEAPQVETHEYSGCGDDDYCSCGAVRKVSEPHRCNGVNGAERHGTQNRCTICGEYRNGWFDAAGMEVLSLPAQSIGPPARVWIQSEGDPVDYCVSATVFSEKPLGDDLEYAHLAPIQEALRVCEANMVEFEGSWDIRKSDYEALVAAIKGETK